MNYKIISPSPKLVVKVEGHLDTITAPALGEALSSNLENIESFVCDLENVDYVSSAGLRLLLTWHKQCKSQNATFTLRNVTPTVKEILSVSGFVKILNIEAPNA